MTKISQLIDTLQAAIAEGSFIRLRLAGYKGPDQSLKNVDIKPVVIKRGDKLSFTWHYKTRDIVKNHDIAEGVDLIRQALDDDFQAANLQTTSADHVLENGKLRQRPPSQTEAVSRDHDRAKQRPIAAGGKAYLTALGITGADGQVLKSSQDKYRQINKYIETLAGHLKALPKDKPVRVVDMGSGKGYLTFALYDYITNELGRAAEVTGVEFRRDLVDLCNTIARDAGFSGLNFVEGSIADFDSAGTDVLIALHACDTATDDALFKGIAANAALVVAAPCCHKQIRREIEAHHQSNDLDFLMRHGIFVERQAEMVTDALRALLLEHAGYSTKVFEFISDAHTPKNVLIVGTKARRTEPEKAALREKLKATKAYFGIGYHHLERLMGLDAA